MNPLPTSVNAMLLTSLLSRVLNNHIIPMQSRDTTMKARERIRVRLVRVDRDFSRSGWWLQGRSEELPCQEAAPD
jgi:hypothetical protein